MRAEDGSGSVPKAAQADAGYVVHVKRRTVGELMNPDVVCLRPDHNVRDAQRVLVEHGVSGAPVVDDAGHVLGVVSQNDLVRHGSKSESASDRGLFVSSLDEYRELAEVQVTDGGAPVTELMTGRVYHVARDTGVAVAANIMRERGIHRLLVIDKGVLVGVITSLDLLRVVEEVC